MLKDSLGNTLAEHMYVSVELDGPIHVVKGQIQVLEIGRVSTLAAPGKPAQITPTRIVVMCPIEVVLDPRGDVATKISALQLPQTYNPLTENPAPVEKAVKKD